MNQVTAMEGSRLESEHEATTRSDAKYSDLCQKSAAEMVMKENSPAALQRPPLRGGGRLVGVLLASSLILGAGAVAFATSGNTPTYTACVNNASGTIKMITAEGVCANNEVRIIWNQQGPAGLTWHGAWDPVATYVAGDAVVHSGTSYIALESSTPNNWLEPGSSGASGSWDVLAAKGDQGEKGDKGDRGDQGPQGVAGVKGDAGVPGVAGPQGPVGPQGAQGPVGPAGPQGPKGDPGTGGATQAYTKKQALPDQGVGDDSRYIQPWNGDFFTFTGTTEVKLVDLPAGSYILSVNAGFINMTFLNPNLFDKERRVQCRFDGDYFDFQLDDAGSEATQTYTKASFHSAPFTAALECRAMNGGSDRSYVAVSDLRINAIKVDSIISQ